MLRLPQAIPVQKYQQEGCKPPLQKAMTCKQHDRHNKERSIPDNKETLEAET